MQLVLIRHLATQANINLVLQGREDTDILSPTPDVQAIITQRRQDLDSRYQFQAILTSSLKRTQQTAAQYGYTDYIVEPLLDELDFGPFSAKPKQHLLDAHGDDWFKDPRQLVLGEPISALAQRIADFVTKYEHYTAVLAFTHGSWARGMLSYLKHQDLRDLNQRKIPNNAIFELSVN